MEMWFFFFVKTRMNFKLLAELMNFYFFLFLKNHLQKKIWWSWEEGDGRWRFTWSETRRDLTVEICRERKRERERAKTLWEWEREGWRYIKNLKRERKSKVWVWVWVWVIGFWVGWLSSDSGVSHEFRVRSSRLRENGTQPGLCCFLLCFANCYAWSLSTAFALFWAPRVCYNIFLACLGVWQWHYVTVASEWMLAT